MPRPGRAGRPVAVCYPASYHVGMSNLGLHRLLELVTDRGDWTPLRAFLPDPRDREDLLRRGERLRTLDRGVRLDQVDLWLVTVSYEEDYAGLWRMLELAGMPPLAREREPEHPKVVVGGFAPTLNPEPVAELADVLLLGPAEATLDPFLDRWTALGRRHGRRGVPGEALGHALSGLPGCYVPREGAPDTLAIPGPRPDWDNRSPGRSCPDCALPSPPPRTRILTPYTEFADRFLVSVGDGCPGACRFCAAGFARRPPRAYPAEALMDAVDEGLASGGRIGLLGAAVSDLPSLPSLARRVEQGGGELSTSSLRVGVRLGEGSPIIGRTATIAPEAGSDALRRAINKPMADEEVLATLAGCVEAGAVRVRTYFLIGLPGADDGEAEALLALVRRGRDRMVSASRGRGKPAELVVSLNAFVPKPDTPFQWAAMASPEVLDRRAALLRKGLRHVGGVRLLWGGARVALRQAALSMGGRGAVELLGAAEDGWWPALRRWHEDRGVFLFEDRPRDQRLPWGFVDRGVSRGFLWREWTRSQAGKVTPRCDVLACTACGACG